MDGLFLTIVIVAAWFWYASARSREQAVAAVRRACERHGQQLLDETVMLVRLRPRRSRSGRMGLSFEYSFEFYGDGEQRRGGRVALFGGRIVALELELPQGTLYDTH